MKFSMDAADLKAAMERMMPILKSRECANVFPDYMHVVANGNGVYIIGDTGHYALEIKLDATVQDHGEAWMHQSDIRKISSLTGWITITASSKDKCICFQSGKKRVELIDHDCTTASLYKNSERDDHLFDILASDLCASIASVSAALACEDARELLKGYNINGKTGKLIACDGYRLHAAKLAMENESMCLLKLNRTFRGEAYAHLRAALKSCMNSRIRVYDTDRFIKFVGDDFVYYVLCYDGEYMNAESIIPKKRDYAFKIDAGELGAIAKEYEYWCKKEGCMALVTRDNKMYAALAQPEFRTVDIVEHFELGNMPAPGDYLTLFAPAYIKDAMAAFGKNAVISAYGEYAEYGSCNVKPIMFESDKLECLVLPVRGSYARADEFGKLVFSFIGDAVKPFASAMGI